MSAKQKKMWSRSDARLCGGCGKSPCICKRFRKRHRKQIPSQLAGTTGRSRWWVLDDDQKFKVKADNFRDLVLRITQTKTLEERMVDEVLEKLDRLGE